MVSVSHDGSSQSLQIPMQRLKTNRHQGDVQTGRWSREWDGGWAHWPSSSIKPHWSLLLLVVVFNMFPQFLK